MIFKVIIINNRMTSNMGELPIVPFGKYKGQPITTLISDTPYFEWCKQHEMLKKYPIIYNICVNQTITTSNSKTPEHNKLQNYFLDTNNQQKLLSKLFKKNNLTDKVNNLFKDTNIIRCFGENIIPEFINKLDNTTIKFEDKFNWDLVLYYEDTQKFTITSNLETEIFDKNKYKEQYDIEEKQKYDNNLLLIDKLIECKKKLVQECKKKYDEEYEEYLDKNQKYENDLNFYIQQKSQNEIDIKNYERKLNVYEITRNTIITKQKKLICQELRINYDDFVNWNDNSYCDKDTKYTTQEKIQLREIVYDKLKLIIKEFEEINKKPKFVEILNIPTKPLLPEKSKIYSNIYQLCSGPESEIYKLFKKYCNITNKMFIFNFLIDRFVSDLNKEKKDYEDEYAKNYEKNFNEHYKEYRLQYYRDIIKKYINENICVYNKNDNQYKITINICNYNRAVCCELKPTLSEDYPVVLRKLKTQIELTQNDKTFFDELNKTYILIIGSFHSNHVSNEQLITIFKQSNIKVIFTNEIFETSKSLAIKYVNKNSEHVLFENKLIEENKFLTDNLLQTQQKLLQAEEKIIQLEEEIVSLKSQKQSKSIKDYFGKK